MPRPRRRPRTLGLAALAAVLAASAPSALAQSQQRQFERAVRDAQGDDDRLEYRVKIDRDLSWNERNVYEVGGFANYTFIYLTDRDDNSRTLNQFETTVFGRFVFDAAHTVFVRGRFRNQQFSPGDSFDGRGDGWRKPFLDRYWYEFDARNMIAANEGRTVDWNINFRGGRQFVDFGAGLVFSEVLLGGRITGEFGNGLAIHGIAGLTPGDEAVTDFDSSRDEFNRDTKRGLFGGMIEYTTPSDDVFYGFGVYSPDFNDDPQRIRGIPGAVADFEYNAAYVGVGANGSFTSQLLYLAEFVYQFGESRSDPFQGGGLQSEEDISAFAARGGLTWVFRDANRSQIKFDTAFASGDDDRLFSTTDTVFGNRPGTDDNAFNSLGFVQTGLAFAPALSNLMLFRAGASTFPFYGTTDFNQLQLGIDVILTAKLDQDAPIEEITEDKTYLGTEIDFTANWRLTSDFTLNARYGMFFPGPAIIRNHTRHFVFFGATLSF
jgi:hypothetical protein